MTRYFIAALLALCFVLGGYGYWQETRLERERARSASLESTVKQYADVIEEQAAAKARSDAALSTRLRAAEAGAKKRKEEYDALQQALAAARDWADAPVPAGIVDWLRSPGAAHTAAPRAPAR